MPYAATNHNSALPPLESLYLLFGIALSALNQKEGERFKEFVKQSPDIDQARFSNSAASGQSEVEIKQKWLDGAFRYTANSLVLTSILASGELVGSTIWGISKYVSKDVIWDTLGATTAAVILQSAFLVGYREEAQELFGIKPAEKRATVAIKMGSKLGQAIGAVAGTSLTLLAEPWILPVAPVLAPYLPFAGLFIGGVAGEVIGAGLGAGLNNLLLSTIGMVPASYKGIKQKGGKFADRIKNSRVEKRKAKEAKAAPKVKQEAEKNAAPVNEQGTGAPKVSLAQLLLEGGEPAQQPNPNTSLVLAKVPFVQVKSREVNRPKNKATYTLPVIGQQRSWLLKMLKNIIPKEVVRNIIQTGNGNQHKSNTQQLVGKETKTTPVTKERNY